MPYITAPCTTAVKLLMFSELQNGDLAMTHALDRSGLRITTCFSRIAASSSFCKYRDSPKPPTRNTFCEVNYGIDLQGRQTLRTLTRYFFASICKIWFMISSITLSTGSSKNSFISSLVEVSYGSLGHSLGISYCVIFSSPCDTFGGQSSDARGAGRSSLTPCPMLGNAFL